MSALKMPVSCYIPQQIMAEEIQKKGRRLTPCFSAVARGEMERWTLRNLLLVSFIPSLILYTVQFTLYTVQFTVHLYTPPSL